MGNKWKHSLFSSVNILKKGLDKYFLIVYINQHNLINKNSLLKLKII